MVKISKINFQTDKAEPATLMELNLSESKNEKIYTYIDKGRLWISFKRDGKMNIFSQMGKARQNAFFYCRFSNKISILNIIRYKNQHYFLTDIQKEDRYAKISSVQIEPVSCSHTETIWGSDEFNRPVEQKGLCTKFQAFFAEKYVQNEPTDVSLELAHLFIAVTDNVIDLSEGMLILVEENSAGIPPGGYEVILSHKTNSFHNEYELMKRADV